MERWGGRGFPRLGVRRIFSLLTAVAAVVAMLFLGCREEVATDLDRNIAPDTYLTGAPAESSTTVYRVRLFWHGNDPDGKVVGYEYAVTDSIPENEDSLGYAYTTRTDSIFVFQVGVNQQVLGHRFYVRAIDNEGQVDPEPAWTFFSAVDLVPPEPVITRAEAWQPGSEERMTITSESEARPDTVPAGWNVEFAWTGLDGDRIINEQGEIVTVGEVVEFEWQLVGRDILTTTGGPADTTILYDDLRDQKYVFALRAVDDAGFAGLDPARRSFVWNRDPQTYFERGLAPDGESRAHYFAESDAWPLREFFAGDTIPLNSSGPPLWAPRPADFYAVVEGYDPDPITENELSEFQYRPAEGIWRGMGDSLIALENLQTVNMFLQARATDGLGRRDGTPAILPVYVNRSPQLRDTLGYDEGQPILQFPLQDEEILLETLLSQGGVLHLEFMAEDPDSTTPGFGYQWRTTGFLYEPQRPLLRATGDPVAYDIQLPDTWLMPGTYQLGVKVTEQVGGQSFQRFLASSVRFHIVE